MDRAVEVTHTADGITLLFDTFSGESKNLLESFKNAGAAFHAAVIEDDGFLPDDVMSVYGFFLGDYRKADSLPGKPLYFNQIQIPDYWRIEGDNSSAKVMDRTRERARIFFTEPTHRRQVKIVDWLDDAGQVRLSEHYNRYGAIFCHTVFNKKGQKALRKFFDVTGREMIVENFVTGDILVRWQDKDWIFRSKTDFIAFFIRCAGLEDTAVYFNSLSYPFFASQALAPNGFRDALFWHEPVGDEIPGNMQIILHDQGTRAKCVFVSRRESYDRLIALGAPSDKVKQLGYIYSFVRENKHRPHILVCTNSENVGHLTELASLMPQMHFHVAAITEMSSKLMSAGQYDNVSLYDAMRSRRIYRNALPDEEIRRELLDNCSTQFDPQISRMFVDMLDKGMVVIDEDNPAAQGYRDNAAIESVADKFISEVMKTMSSQEKADSVDYLTGLYMRSRGQQVIAALMQDNDGCLAFIDMDNLKKVNDVHGHKAGDRALKLIGNLLAKETENETFAACRIGGDEFLIFMPYSDRASVESVIKRIFEGFESAREADCEIKEAALSAGLCMTTKGAMFESDYTKADKALYYVKQNCKGSYFFYEQLLADNKENTNLSADLRNVAKLLKESGSYTGALDLNYREFARIYEFVNNVGDRHNHNCYLVMVTMNTLPEQLADIEEIEKALDCMEQSIRSKIRKVDVCTRYSSMQYLIILFEPQENQIPNVMERIFMHYYKLCDREDFKPQYEYIKMTEVK